MSLRHKILYFLLMVSIGASAQLRSYKYMRPLEAVSTDWHRVVLPDEIFSKISSDLTDIRVYGITKNSDTIEAPYILTPNYEFSVPNLPARIINRAQKDSAYYFTIELTGPHIINELDLQLKEENFDWLITLEGSHDQTQWFKIVDDYRVMAIKNSLTDFRFTRISFSESNYRFYRLMIPSSKEPDHLSVRIQNNLPGLQMRKNYQVKEFTINELKSSRQTEVLISLSMPVSINRLLILAKKPNEFYRPVTLQYCRDSIKTRNGWKYIYSDFSTGVLSSADTTGFQFKNVVTGNLRILIENNDNAPLNIDSVSVSGMIHELLVRFSDPANYFLVYGNNNVGYPDYELKRFKILMRDSAEQLKVGEEMLISKKSLSNTTPLFANKVWLWVIIIVIILILGGFSLKMLSTDSGKIT